MKYKAIYIILSVLKVLCFIAEIVVIVLTDEFLYIYGFCAAIIVIIPVKEHIKQKMIDYEEKGVSMNKAQWKAIYDFCKDNGYYDPSEVLQTLKAMGVVGSRDGFPDLARYPKNGTYEAMIDFLTENLN